MEETPFLHWKQSLDGRTESFLQAHVTDRTYNLPQLGIEWPFPSYESGFAAILAGRLIGLLLVFASPKIVQYVQDEIAEFVVLLRKEIKDSLTRQGMQNGRAPGPLVARKKWTGRV